MEPPHITFICSGNICRSPMAEAIAREMLERAKAPCRVSSAGTLGIEDRPADEKAVHALFMLGIDLTAHRSRGVSAEHLRETDAIVVMAEEHAEVVTHLDPSAGGRLHRLWEFTDDPGDLLEIRDPIGRDLEDFIACRDALIECLRNWIRFFVEGR